MDTARAERLALGIRLWQAQRQSHNGIQASQPYTEDDVDTSEEAVAMAKECGEQVRVAYLASLESVPVMSVKIFSLDEVKRAAKSKKKMKWKQRKAPTARGIS